MNTFANLSATTNKVSHNQYVSSLGDILNWIRDNRNLYIEEIAKDFLNSSSRARYTCGNWYNGIEWDDEKTRRHLFEIRLYDENMHFTKTMLKKRLIHFTDTVCDSKNMTREITGAIKEDKYQTATFRCGRVRIILVEVG